ncbi:MAG: sugar phosphate isomerase/epimerase [Herbinix sp.]|nr:sugar phosphate isomerase/epimerase [Herbinix sp.]
MELCYNLQTCMDSYLERDLELCEREGFKAIEINFPKAKKYLEKHSLEQLEQLLHSYQMKVATLNAIFGTSFCDDKQWTSVTDQFKYACELGQACDCNKVIVLSCEAVHLPTKVSDEDIMKNSVEVLHKLADIGSANGMNIGYEPVGTMAVPNLQTATKIIQEVNRKEVGMVIDDFNLYLWDLLADVDEIKDLDPAKITIVHLNDAAKIPFARLDQNHRCMPGDGRIDVVNFMKCVKANGYHGYVSVEVLNPEIWAKGPEVVIPEAYEKANKILASI